MLLLDLLLLDLLLTLLLLNLRLPLLALLQLLRPHVRRRCGTFSCLLQVSADKTAPRLSRSLIETIAP